MYFLMKTWSVAVAFNRNPVILDQVNMDYYWKFSLTLCLLHVVHVKAISRKKLSSEQVKGIKSSFSGFVADTLSISKLFLTWDQAIFLTPDVLPVNISISK